MPINNKRKNWGAVRNINKYKKTDKALEDKYKELPNEPELTVEERGNILDEINVPPRGILSIGHTGPFNILGAAQDKTDKAAQHHDIRYGDIGNSAYFNYNDADEQYLKDIEGENNIRANIGRTFFNTKKKYAPYYKPNIDNSDSSSFQLSPISSSSDSSHIEGTPLLPHSTPDPRSFFQRVVDSSLSGLSSLDSFLPNLGIEERFDSLPIVTNQEQDSGLSPMPPTPMAIDQGPGTTTGPLPLMTAANPLMSTAVASSMTQGPTGMQKMIHTASSAIPTNKHTIKISNTYKVFLNNSDDITFKYENCYRHWSTIASDAAYTTITNFKKDKVVIPIYGYNSKLENKVFQDGAGGNQRQSKYSAYYTPLSWRIVPTLLNENYITPNDWDNILRMGYTKMKIKSRKVKLGGLYQLHNYTTSAQGEVQVQGNPYVELCRPVGPYFKHEHYPIQNGLGKDTYDNADVTSTVNAPVDVVVMNATLPFTCGDPIDAAAMGLDTACRALDYNIGDPFTGYENTLRPYYYPAYTGEEIVGTNAEKIDALRNDWHKWYPDLSRTQNVMLTDNLDNIEFDVPCDTTEINMSDYALWARPGQKAYQTSDASKYLCDYSTFHIGQVTYANSLKGGTDFESRTKQLYENYPPLLIRAPNHYNTGNSSIKNNCYFYVTYETELDIGQHEFYNTSTLHRPLDWLPISSHYIGYNKIADKIGFDGPVISSFKTLGAKCYQSNLRYTHNYSPSTSGDNPDSNWYQSMIIKDNVCDPQQGTNLIRTIDKQVQNVSGGENDVVNKIRCNVQRKLQNDFLGV